MLLVGGNYLRGQFSAATSAPMLARTGTVAAVRSVKDDSSPVKVHVAGAVNLPGVYELDDGDRVADALTAAGGPLPEAALDSVNLAAVLIDGEQIYVPAVGQGQPAAAGAPAGGVSVGSSAGAGGNRPININNATVDQLEQLDGVGEKTAEKIIAYREEHGGFASTEEIMEVPGIGPAKFEGIKDDISV